MNHHVACKFPRFFHKPPTLYCYWETIIAFKWQKQGSRSSFRPLTGWGQNKFLENFRENSLKRRIIPLTTRLFSHWSIPLRIELRLLIWSFLHRKSGNCNIELVRENCQYVENPRILVFFSVHWCQRKGTLSFVNNYLTSKKEF